MSGFLYYIRGTQQKPTAELLEQFGLGGEIVGSFVPCYKFIDGSNGVIFTINGRFKGEMKKIGFYNETQDWTDFPIGANVLSIGVNLDDPVLPNDLLRKDYLSGHKLILGDGREWIIPLARRLPEGCILPKEWLMIREGELTNTTLSKYLELQNIAEKIAVHCGLVEGEKDLEIFSSDAKLYMLCVSILKVNYSLSFREISVLKLIDSNNAIAIPQAIVDMPYILSVMEKLETEEGKKKSIDTTNGQAV